MSGWDRTERGLVTGRPLLNGNVLHSDKWYLEVMLVVLHLLIQIHSSCCSVPCMDYIAGVPMLPASNFLLGLANETPAAGWGAGTGRGWGVPCSVRPRWEQSLLLLGSGYFPHPTLTL